MNKICPSCGGSGRYVHASGRAESCLICGGLGSVYEAQRPSGGGPPPAGGGGEGCLILLVFVFGLLAVAMVVAGYAASSELFWHYWARANVSDTNWSQLGIYVGGSSLAVAVIARFWGTIIGTLVGLIPAGPMMTATKGNVNIWYIVFGDDFIDSSFTAFVAILGIAGINFWIASAVQKMPNASGFFPEWQWLKSRNGMVATAVMLVIVALAISMMRRAVKAW